MSFVCPDCGGPGLEISASLELPADAWWDEVALQVLSCSLCGFGGAAVYEESRRGALDSEAWNHHGYRLTDDGLRTLRDRVRACPDPRNGACACATHRVLAARGESARWSDVLASEGEFALKPAW